MASLHSGFHQGILGFEEGITRGIEFSDALITTSKKYSKALSMEGRESGDWKILVALRKRAQSALRKHHQDGKSKEESVPISPNDNGIMITTMEIVKARPHQRL